MAQSPGRKKLIYVGAFGGYVLYHRVTGEGLIVVLQQSLALASVLSLGHLGTTELGGISEIGMY
jgi:hypothetical protein